MSSSNLIIIFFIIFSFSYYCSCENEDSSKSKGDQKAFDPYLMSPKVAKALLRVQRSWIKKHIWPREWARENKKESNIHNKERLNERNKQDKLNRVCPDECWGPFKGWNPCSKTCGPDGVQYNERDVVPSKQCENWVRYNGCPGDRVKYRPCNRFCLNNGTLDNYCLCTNGHSGVCCEKGLKCRMPGRPVNADYRPIKAHYEIGENIKYICKDGFNMTGNNTITCTAPGDWKPSPPFCQ